jgi:hypothetical protein
VKTWATEKSNFPAVSIDKLPVPRTLDDIKAQCPLAGVEITISGGLYASPTPARTGSAGAAATGQGNGRGRRSDLDQGLTYTIPHFYEVFCGPLNVERSARRSQDLSGLPNRDYSISSM